MAIHPELSILHPASSQVKRALRLAGGRRTSCHGGMRSGEDVVRYEAGHSRSGPNTGCDEPTREQAKQRGDDKRWCAEEVRSDLGRVVRSTFGWMLPDELLPERKLTT